MFTQLLAVSRNAFVESIRQPFFLVWTAVIGFAVVLIPYLSAYTFEDDNKLVTDITLSTLLTGGLILAAFTASGVVNREIEKKTALTVITKPLPRPIFVIGKYIGVAGAVTLAWWIWALLQLISLRQGAFSTASTPWDLPVVILGSAAVLAALGIAVAANFFLNRHFGALFTRWLAILLPIAFVLISPLNYRFQLQSPLASWEWPVLLAVFFILLASLLFAAIAVAASTRLRQVSTLAVLIVVFLLGLTSDYAFGYRAEDRPVQYTNDAGDTVERIEQGELWAKTAYAATPNLQFLWLSDALTQGTARGIGPRFVLLVSGYTVLLICGVLGLGVALFQTRQTA